MRDSYTLSYTRAYALTGPCAWDARTWFLQSIYVPPTQRKKGYGTQLLALVCADADAEGWTLALAVQPQGGRRSIIYGELIRWYEKHGFVLDYDNVMVRRPKLEGRTRETNQRGQISA